MPAPRAAGLLCAAYHDENVRALDGSVEQTVRPLYARASYVPTGHLIFALGGVIVAQPFDPMRGVVSGEPTQLASDVVS